MKYFLVVGICFFWLFTGFCAFAGFRIEGQELGDESTEVEEGQELSDEFQELEDNLKSKQEILRFVNRENYPETPFERALEWRHEVKLTAAEDVVDLLYERYLYGVEDHESRLLVRFAEEQGFEVLRFHPKQRDTTLESLNKMAEVSERCMKMPYLNLWSQMGYFYHISRCSVFYEEALRLIPLENKRLATAETCGNIRSCSEYKKIEVQITDNSEFIEILSAMEARFLALYAEQFNFDLDNFLEENRDDDPFNFYYNNQDIVH